MVLFADEYGVKKIISHFVDVDGKVKYEVEWENFPGENTFEPEENLEVPFGFSFKVKTLFSILKIFSRSTESRLFPTQLTCLPMSDW